VIYFTLTTDERLIANDQRHLPPLAHAVLNRKSQSSWEGRRLERRTVMKTSSAATFIAAALVAVASLFASPAQASEAELKRIRDGLMTQSKEQIFIFSAPWCALCKAAKFHFTTQKLAFQEINIEGGLDNQIKFHAFGGGGIPLILVKGEQLRGFSIDAFEDIVNPEAEEAAPTVAQPVKPGPKKPVAKKVASK
jgi:glutaredoxin